MAAATAASSSISWATLRAVRAAVRCLAGRLWWTALEAGLLAVIVSPLGLHYHTACCIAATAARCLFQGTEGALLPPSGMNACGIQMTVAHLLFVVVTACCYQVG